jgi:hypothetical protein
MGTKYLAWISDQTDDLQLTLSAKQLLTPPQMVRSFLSDDGLAWGGESADKGIEEVPQIAFVGDALGDAIGVERQMS